MKKVFISCPMKGRTKESVERSFKDMTEFAKIVLGEPIEVLHTMFEDNVPKDADKRVYRLGESIKMLSQADYVIVPDLGYFGEYYAGCEFERRITEEYFKYNQFIHFPGTAKCFEDIQTHDCSPLEVKEY